MSSFFVLGQLSSVGSGEGWAPQSGGGWGQEPCLSQTPGEHTGPGATETLRLPVSRPDMPAPPPRGSQRTPESMAGTGSSPTRPCQGPLSSKGVTEASHGCMLAQGSHTAPRAATQPQGASHRVQATASHLGLRPWGRLWGQCQKRTQASGRWAMVAPPGRLRRWLGLRWPKVRSAGSLSGRQER